MHYCEPCNSNFYEYFTYFVLDMCFSDNPKKNYNSDIIDERDILLTWKLFLDCFLCFQRFCKNCSREEENCEK